MRPLWISGTTSRLDCSRQLKRYVAQLGHTVGVVKPGGGKKHVEKAIAAKRTAFKAWKAGKGTRASYDAAKRNARHAVYEGCSK